MGLSAIVFKSRARIEAELGRAAEAVDPDTGEAIFTDPEPPFETLIADEAHLGNVSQVGYLRGRVVGCPILLDAVLHSGSHSGDVLALDRVPALLAELAALPTADDPDLATLAGDLRRLGAAALAEGNPIAFV